jgi:hypothetical protein
MNVDRALNGLLKLAIALAVIAGGAFAVMAVVNTMALDRTAAERRALVQRSAELDLAAMGSALSCLDGGAGEAVENACEAKVFADPQRAANAVAYTAARLSLLAEAAKDPAVLDGFAATRRAIELDRYGFAAHVLATRDGCTAEQCAAFALLRDTTVLKANLKAQAYDQYVSRYAAGWNKEPEKQAPVAAAPPAGAPVAATPEASQPTGVPVSSKYDFPSAASIPPVSIMNSEPPLPKGATAPGAPQAKGETKPDDDAVPVPPKRPQTAATPAPATPQAR